MARKRTAVEGAEAVRVLGATKGPFSWRFTHRRVLLRGGLTHWGARATATGGTPGQRLARVARSTVMPPQASPTVQAIRASGASEPAALFGEFARAAGR